MRYPVKFFLLTFLMSIFILACGDENEEREEQEERTEQLEATAPESLEVTPMNEVPYGVDANCACFYAKTVQDFENDNFIYISNMQDKAFIKINGTIETINLNNPDAGDYSVLVTIEKDEEREAGRRWKEGYISLSTHGGASEVIDFVGECGCDETE